MVNLPEIPTRIVTSQAPTSSVSPGQIESPYRMLADNLNKIGEVGNEVAGKFAEDAGRDAVSADGKTIDKPSIPIIGPASAEFARASRFTALARVTPEIENKMTELRLAHPNDPQGFRAAADAYSKELGASINDPALKGPVERTALNQASSNYRSVLEQTNNTNIQNVKTSVTSQISDLTNRMATAAFTGGIDTPEYKQWQSDLGALYGELGKDARLGYPKERIESEISTLISQNKTMAIAGEAVRMMDGTDINGRAKAKSWLIDKVYNDPTLNLSLAQRHQAVTTAMGLMEARSAENKALIDANKETTSTLLAQLKTSAPYNPITVNDAIANAAKIGDAESWWKLNMARGMHEWDQTMRALPLPQQLAALKELDRARTPFESRLVGSESSGNPRLINQLGYAGLYQFGAPRLADMGVYTPGANEDLKGWSKSGADAPGKWSGTFNIPGFPQVKTVQDFLQSPEAQRAAYGAHQGKMDQEIKALGLDKFEGQTIGGVTINRTALYGMMHLGGAQGTLNALSSGGANAARDANGTSVMDYAKKFGQANNPGEAWFNQARIEQVGRTREYLKTTAEGYVKTIENQVNKTGDLSDDLIRNAAAVIAETGQTELKQRMNSALLAHYGVKEIDKLPEPIRAAWVQQSRPGIDSPIAAQVYDHMAASIKASADAMKDTPYSTYAVRTRGAPPPAYNFNDPQAIAVVAANRAATQKAIRANDGTGPVSVFEGKEAEAFANTLTNGDPAAAGAALNGLASLPDDVYEATLAQKPVAAAVTGIMSSRDPARMAAGMAAADKLWRSNPADAQDALGSAAITKLQAWQGLKDSFTPVELAERLNVSDSPSTTKARAEAKEAAEKEVSILTPGDMAYKLGTSWGIPILSRVANVVTGATPAVPFDSIKGGELVADYRATYTALRAYGVDADKASDLAVKRLGSTWGVSATAGNQVMKNPPERAYPAIAGSHDWMQADLTKWIASKAGPELQPGGRSLEMGIGGAGQTRNWTLAGMISDGQTQAEIAAGKPPSYQVAIRKADGTLDIIPSRIAFDPSEHIAAHGARLEDRRQAVNFLNNGQFGNAMPLP